MSLIFPTVYWFCQPNMGDRHQQVSNRIIYNFVFAEEQYMPVNDKWFICLN